MSAVSPQVDSVREGVWLRVLCHGLGRMVNNLTMPAGHMTIRTGLDMAAKRVGATLHDGVCGSAHVGGQGMALLIGRKDVLEERLERDERHRGLRTHGRRRSSGCFLQYHAHHPRDKRLVQRPICLSCTACLYCSEGGGEALTQQHHCVRPHACALAPAPRPAGGHAMASLGSPTPPAHGCAATEDAASLARAPAFALRPRVARPPRPVALTWAAGG